MVCPWRFRRSWAVPCPQRLAPYPWPQAFLEGGFKVTKLGLIYRGDPPVNKWIYNGILVGHTYMYIYIHFIHIYKYIYICLYIYMYMYVYIYTCTRMCWIIGIHHELLVLPSSKWT
jgi:hypothetical protein